MGEQRFFDGFKKGEELAFIEVYELYFQEVYNFVAYSVTEDIKEDLTQEIFFKVYRSMGNFKGNSTIKTWIFNIAKRTIFDWYRNNRTRTINIADTHSIVADENTPEFMFEEREQMDVIINNINMLKPDQKTVILLRKVHGFTIKETSIIMGWSEGKVKSILHRALSNLKEGIDPNEGESENDKKTESINYDN